MTQIKQQKPIKIFGQDIDPDNIPPLLQFAGGDLTNGGWM